MKNALIRHAKKQPQRQGAALVEFAMILPILVMVIMGMFEFGRGIMATEVLNHAARLGARNGSLTTGTTASVTTAVNELLVNAGVNGTTVKVLVNGAATEVGNADSGDEIQVTVTVPYANVTWIGNPKYLAGKTLTGRCVMRRE
jgi:Flp pilus assembly protein TadG